MCFLASSAYDDICGMHPTANASFKHKLGAGRTSRSTSEPASRCSRLLSRWTLCLCAPPSSCTLQLQAVISLSAGVAARHCRIEARLFGCLSQQWDRSSLLVQFHGRDGLGDVPEAHPSADSITLQPQQGALCTFGSLLLLARLILISHIALGCSILFSCQLCCTGRSHHAGDVR